MAKINNNQVPDGQLESSGSKPGSEQPSESSKILSMIVDNIPDMIFLKDAFDLRFMLFNKAGEKILGHSTAELLGKNDYDFFPKEQADFFIAKDREVLASGQLIDIPSEPIETADHQVRYLHTKKIPILDEDGKEKYLLGISEDITEQKKSDEALNQTREEYNTFLHQLPIGFYRRKLQAGPQLMESNPALLQMFGYEESEARKMSSLDLYVHPEDAASIGAELATKGHVDAREFEAVKKDGTHIWVQVWSKVFGSGDNAYAEGVIMDISTRKTAEIQLKKQTVELEKINKYMIDRELKMVELKKELAKCQQANGKRPNSLK